MDLNSASWHDLESKLGSNKQSRLTLKLVWQWQEPK
jgi:hypothetical protein